MEYTALLAGGPFTDAPACVDGELAAVMRHANDVLSAADRPRLLPLLGRAIGLVVPGPVATRPRRRSRRPVGEEEARAAAEHAAAVTRLRQSVARRLTTALEGPAVPAVRGGPAPGPDVDRLFWSLMSEPCPVSTSAAYVDRRLSRLGLLHECYEQAAEELGTPRTVPAGRESPDVAPVPC